MTKLALMHVTCATLFLMPQFVGRAYAGNPAWATPCAFPFLSP